jgi:hypothetical protein
MSFNEDLVTPAPASVDVDPPAYSQPTLPPPADELEVGAPRRGVRFLAVGLLACAAATGGAYTFLPHVSPAAATASIAAAPRTTTAQLDKLAAAFPAEGAESACSESAERVPVVLYSAIDPAASTSKLEGELFSGATPVTGPTLTVSGQRIALLRTSENHGPEASAEEPRPGHYRGTLVVFDAATSKPLCQTVVDAWSTKDLRWANVSPGAMRADYARSVQGEMGEAENRLNVELSL